MIKFKSEKSYFFLWFIYFKSHNEIYRYSSFGLHLSVAHNIVDELV